MSELDSFMLTGCTANQLIIPNGWPSISTNLSSVILVSTFDAYLEGMRQSRMMMMVVVVVPNLPISLFLRIHQVGGRASTNACVGEFSLGN